jgi:hypothetical protein
MRKIIPYLITAVLLPFLIKSTFAQTSWNSGFEQGLQDWQTPAIIHGSNSGQPGPDTVEITALPVHSGNKALEITAKTWSPKISVRSELQPLLRDTSYQIVKMWYLYQGGLSRKFGARVQLYDAQKQAIPGALFTRAGSPIPAGDWFPINIPFAVPASAKYYQVELYWQSANGKVTFDDISLHPFDFPLAVKTGYCLPTVSNLQHQVWVASPLEKIYPDASPPAANGDAIRLSAAKGEAQSIQLVYKPGSAESALSVAVDNLQMSGKVLSSNTINIAYVGDVDITGNVSQFGRAGLTPDPLFPDAPHTLAAGVPQSIWITATVPRNATAGIYQTTLHITTNASRVDVPLQLEVYNFALPQQPALKTIANSHITPAAREEFRKHLLANRITSENGYNEGVMNLRVTANPDNTVNIDWAPWDARMEQYFADGMTYFSVPNILFGSITGFAKPDKKWASVVDSPFYYGTKKWDDAVADYTHQMYIHLQQKGWLQYAVWYIWDEPMGTEMRGYVRHIADIVRQNAPQAKMMVTSWPVNDGERNIDIWCPQNSLYQPASRRLTNSEFWIYNNGLYLIDKPDNLTRMRQYEWWMWDNDISGLLWWSTSYGWNTDLYHHPATNIGQNGQGFLFYPGPDGDKSKVIDSMKAAAYRSGVNDYDYFTLLAKAQDNAVEQLHLAGKAPSGKELVKVLLSAALNRNDPDRLERIRDLAARLIVFLKDQPLTALQLAPDYWDTKMLQGYVSTGTYIMTGDKNVAVNDDGQFSINFTRQNKFTKGDVQKVLFTPST